MLVHDVTFPIATLITIIGAMNIGNVEQCKERPLVTLDGCKPEDSGDPIRNWPSDP